MPTGKVSPQISRPTLMQALNAAARLGDQARAQGGHAELHEDLKRATMVARFMDSQFSLFGIKFGADALAGLIPVVGDTLALLPALYPVYLAQKHGLGKRLVMRMGLNIGIDWAVGLVPVVGDVFDVLTRANVKNVQLLHRAAEKHKRVIVDADPL